ncbi:N-formylglutamate amidohydrolase [Rhizobium leguminosarum bv. viciae 248]|uniref:N-formylglutamate amidohydrolase n=1 Tax=Rhizobium leguminosarum TaxID=384 RepID=UPI000362E40D|nr:N-formylglutamate amidohydrolase [Rhizobium leguminosarum]NKM61109.1 N-formylglutamate amidohydrolase [Rhizobium leguminosarum bv. viciae]MBY5758634.1 N-formylglutamate amidohydrolase [Rhizobium leguminosarum]MBY5764733.1 N-formylglutamate amidohydrolase [Rhizobium leguminosarum]MBY5809242.1 N-formylglutamate amidohydrolase [Rhizobium leguminosarum]MCA2410018.1 N-formylglutamate amidohydrolase [Rhizobium leguminosarum]
MPEIREYELFEVHEPVSQTIPFVYNSPHSGRIYPPEFIAQSRLEGIAIRRSEDHYVDELFGSAVALGAPLLAANFPRAYLDVNREPYELDPRMFDGLLPPYANVNSLRVAGGLGTIPRIVAENMEIYARRLPVQEGLDRVEAVYKPYHAALRRLIARTHVQFGFGVLIDCHSMPGNVRVAGSTSRPDFIIGDRYGTSASAELSRAAIAILEEMGFAAIRNKPYAGGFITEHYGRPSRGLHALQIEVNRAIYVDELTLEKRDDFAAVADAVADFMQQMADYVEKFAGERALAAE